MVIGNGTVGSSSSSSSSGSGAGIGISTSGEASPTQSVGAARVTDEEGSVGMALKINNTCIIMLLLAIMIMML